MFASPSPFNDRGQFKGAIVIFIQLHISPRPDSKVIDMKRREDVVVVMVGWEEGTLVCDGKREKKKKKRKKEEGEKENPSTPRATFLRIQGNRFRDRKGAALIALPARSRGLGTRSFFLFPPPILFLSLRPPFLAKLDISIVRPAPRKANVSNVGRRID